MASLQINQYVGVEQHLIPLSFFLSEPQLTGEINAGFWIAVSISVNASSAMPLPIVERLLSGHPRTV